MQAQEVLLRGYRFSSPFPAVVYDHLSLLAMSRFILTRFTTVSLALVGLFCIERGDVGHQSQPVHNYRLDDTEQLTEVPSRCRAVTKYSTWRCRQIIKMPKPMCCQLLSSHRPTPFHSLY